MSKNEPIWDEAPSVFVVDDDPIVCRTLRRTLARGGFTVSTFADGTDALEAVEQGQAVDLLLTDIMMPGMTGLELLRRFKAVHADTPVLMLTGVPNTLTAIEAMKAGAAHYLLKPVVPDEILMLINRTLETARTRAENRRLRRCISSPAGYGPILGDSDAMRRLLEEVDRLADLNETVLVTGENGTGKELLARHLHGNSHRREGPFLVVNCGAIPQNLLESELFGHRKGAFTGAVAEHVGLFEAAREGTLLLDEIGDLPLEMQVKLLRVLETHEVRAVGDTRDRHVDVRVLAATNRDLDEMMAQGAFREDLYYRLNVFRLEIPPLRERQKDIPVLAQHFLRDCAKRFNRPVRTFTPAAMEMLCSHHWPGNVRELSHAVQRAVVMCGAGLVDAVHLRLVGRSARPAHPPEQDAEVIDLENLDLKAALERSRVVLEQRYIQLALERSNGNKTRAAKLLKISYRALLYKLKEYEF